MNKGTLKNDSLNIGKQYNLWVIFIVLAGLILRLYRLDFSYSNDELSALSRVGFDTFSELVQKGFYVDGHPGGVQVFLFYWSKLFGMDEWIIRLPFALAGAIGIWFTIKIFSRWFSPSTGLLAGAFIAFLAFPLLYSQIARPYGIGLTISMIMVWFWTKLLFDEKPKVWIALAFSLSAAACMYNHYFSFLLALIAGISGLFFLKKDRIPHYLGAGFLAAVIFSPHIYITINHLSIGGVGLWLAKPTWAWLFEHLAFVFNNSYIIALLLVLIGVVQFFTFKKTGLLKFRIISLVLFLLPFLIGFFYSKFVNPVLQHSVLIFSFPFMLGFIFSFAGKIPIKWMNPMLVLIMISGIVDTVFVSGYYNKQHFGEFNGVAAAISDWNSKYGAEKITRAINVNNPWYVNFYLDEEQKKLSTYAQTDNRGGADLDSLKHILDQCETPFFLYAWTKPAPVEIRDMILARFPCMIERVDFGGLSEASLYSRGDDERCILRTSDTLFYLKLNQADTSALTEKVKAPEYFPGFEGKLSDTYLDFKSTDALVAISSLRISDSLSGALLVASFHDEDGETIYWSAARFDLFTRANSNSKIRLTIPISEKKLLHKRMKLYVWNPKLKSIYPDFISLVVESDLQK
jgi:hypothetical protein